MNKKDIINQIKIKKSFFDKLDDSSVKYAFGLAYIVGAFVIFF